MRKLIYISLIALAGCETVLTPQQPITGGSPMSDYFWHDTTYRYQVMEGSQVLGTQTLQVEAGGTFIADQNNGSNPTLLIASTTNDKYALSGFSPSDVFGVDPSFQVVTDTTIAAPQNETIRSIATATLGFGQPTLLYALSDSVLYELDPAAFKLQRIGAFPAYFTLAEDAQDINLFAYKLGSDSLMWTSDKVLWTLAKVPSGITAFASSNYFFDVCWFACGTDVYRISHGSDPLKVASLPSKIVAITPETNGSVAIGLDNGAIYDMGRTGAPHLRQTLPYPLLGIALVSSGLSDPIFASTANGLYTVASIGTPKLVDQGAVSAIFSTGNSVFAGMTTDSVFHYNPTGSRYNGYENPNGGTIKQFAHPISGIPSPSYGIYALSGTSIFRRDSDAAGSRWVMANQMISSQPAFHPGSLTLLDSNSSWNAGFIERIGGGLLRGYSYEATSSGPQASVTINGVTYSNVIIVNFTSKANGLVDTAGVPQYNIYFQKGVGPAVIERIENGKSVMTALPK